jgi:hypothetical protein
MYVLLSDKSFEKKLYDDRKNLDKDFIFGKPKISWKYYKTKKEITLYNVKSWVEQQVSEEIDFDVENFRKEFLQKKPYYEAFYNQ